MHLFHKLKNNNYIYIVYIFENFFVFVTIIYWNFIYYSWNRSLFSILFWFWNFNQFIAFYRWTIQCPLSCTQCNDCLGNLNKHDTSAVEKAMTSVVSFRMHWIPMENGINSFSVGQPIIFFYVLFENKISSFYLPIPCIKNYRFNPCFIKREFSLILIKCEKLLWKLSRA